MMYISTVIEVSHQGIPSLGPFGPIQATTIVSTNQRE